MSWCFALVNGRLAELYFEKRRGKPVILGHAYVQESDFKTIREQRYIAADTKKYRLTYRNRTYTDQRTRTILASGDIQAR